MGQQSFAKSAKPANSWTAALQFAGLAVFTVIVVTERFPLAQLAIALALMGLIFSTTRVRFPPCFWWGIALVAWALITSFFAIDPSLARSDVLERFKVMLIFLVVLNALRTEKQVKLYLMIIVGAFMVYPARGALVNYFHGITVFGRAIWNRLYENPNDLAGLSLLALGAALALATTRAQTRVVRWGASASALLLIIVVLLTQSRGAFLGLVIGFGPPMLGRLVKRRSIAVYGLIATAIIVAVLPDTLWTRLSGMANLTSAATIAQADPEGSAAQRWEIQKTAWRVFADHPLVGIGLGCYPLANDAYAPWLGRRDTHDTYLNLAAEVGLPGLALWGGLILSVLLRPNRATVGCAEKSLPVQIGWVRRSVVGYLVAGLFGTYSGLTMFYLVLATLWSAEALSTNVVATRKTAPQTTIRRY